MISIVRLNVGSGHYTVSSKFINYAAFNYITCNFKVLEVYAWMMYATVRNLVS
jgi:hypothetical protein